MVAEKTTTWVWVVEIKVLRVKISSVLEEKGGEIDDCM